MIKHWYLIGRAGVSIERRIIGTACAALGSAFIAIQGWRLWRLISGATPQTEVSPSDAASTYDSVVALAAVGLAGILIGLLVAAVWRALKAPKPVSPTDETAQTGITIEGEVIRKDD